jgi:arylsulfatase A-like enzyme
VKVQVIMVGAMLLMLVAQAAGQPFKSVQDMPNILLIVADDMGWSDLGCFGGEIDTPNLDRLAAQGVRFTEYHVNPMCVVTRTSLMSGHTHSQSAGYSRSLPIAKLMKRAGYATSISGKWQHPAKRSI